MDEKLPERSQKPKRQRQLALIQFTSVSVSRDLEVIYVDAVDIRLMGDYALKDLD